MLDRAVDQAVIRRLLPRRLGLSPRLVNFFFFLVDTFALGQAILWVGYTSIFPCYYRSSNAPYTFVHLRKTPRAVTLELDFNDIGLSDTSSTAPDILWYQLVLYFIT
jgi:hypothetical protein